MKRTLAMVESELEEAKQRVEALKAEREKHPEQVERKSWFIAGKLTDGLFKRFVTDAQGPRLVGYQTTYDEASSYVKDSLYRDEWEVEMRFSDGTRFSETAEFWKYDSEPIDTCLDCSPTRDAGATFNSEEALWDAFYIKNGKNDKQTLAAIALAAFCTCRREGDDGEDIRGAWEKFWCAEKQESNDDSDSV